MIEIKAKFGYGDDGFIIQDNSVLKVKISGIQAYVTEPTSEDIDQGESCHTEIIYSLESQITGVPVQPGKQFTEDDIGISRNNLLEQKIKDAIPVVNENEEPKSE